jgi:hypothetical protein
MNWEATLRHEAIRRFLAENLPCPGAGAIKRHLSDRRYLSKKHPNCQAKKTQMRSAGA